MDVQERGTSTNLDFNEPEEVVNHKGSSWMKRRSKSQNGMFYYFNTVTREAVWNLNDAEVRLHFLFYFLNS